MIKTEYTGIFGLTTLVFDETSTSEEIIDDLIAVMLNHFLTKTNEIADIERE